jgi:hypothetical protein
MKIEGFFSNLKRAKETLDKLKKNGFENAVVDINEHYNDHRNVQTNLAGTETGQSNSGLVLESSGMSAGSGREPLEAASPMVSGFGRFEEIADVNCKLSVDASEQKADKARQIIRESGGDLESPNFRKPKMQTDTAEVLLGNIYKEVKKGL